MAKLMVALAMMAVLAVAADKTLTNDTLRLGTFLVLGFFTMRIIFAYTRQHREKLEEQGK